MANALRFLLFVASTVPIFCVVNGANTIASVDLGLARDFSVLAGSTITNTGSSSVVGIIGVAPGTSITGFPPGIALGGIATASQASAAQTALTSAFTDASTRSGAISIASELGAATLTPGIYNTASGSFALTGTLTLDGASDPNAMFIFQSSTLITAGASRILLTNGAQACHVYWAIGSSATIGGAATFVGVIMAQTTITTGGASTIHGNLLARNGAVNLDFTTVDTCNAQSVCVPNPCANTGSCASGIGSAFTCTCATGWTGATCAVPTVAPNLCIPMPCLHGGSCLAGVCTCTTGWTGATCAVTVVTDLCATVTCLHSGVCASGVCTCTTGWTGATCAVAVVPDLCTPNPCLHGSCLAGVCTCDNGWTGVDCATVVVVPDLCSPNPCLNNGLCTAGVCTCTVSWTGVTCAVPTVLPSPPLDVCASSPCGNGGTCRTDNIAAWWCVCPTGFWGTSCQQSLCNPNPCKNGTCLLDAAGNAVCSCAVGYISAGGSCTESTCTLGASPCLNGGACRSDGTQTWCQCSAGYWGNNCENWVCNPSPCMNGGKCARHPTRDSPVCTCLLGGQYTGVTCEEVNPCKSTSPCLNNGACRYEGGSQWCECAAGFWGLTCSNSICNPSPCANGGECVIDSHGLASCSCTDDFCDVTCLEPNHCMANPPFCANGGICHSDGKGGHWCDCLAGFCGRQCQWGGADSSSANLAFGSSSSTTSGGSSAVVPVWALAVLSAIAVVSITLVALLAVKLRRSNTKTGGVQPTPAPGPALVTASMAASGRAAALPSPRSVGQTVNIAPTPEMRPRTRGTSTSAS